MATSKPPSDGDFPGRDEIEKVSRLRPSDLAGDVLAAVANLGGEAKRSEIIQRAVELGGWSDEQLSVRSHYAGAARTWHVQTCADYAITVCRDRGHLESPALGRWRLTEVLEAAAVGSVTPHPFGRVFTAGVGTANGPVEDDWSAADQKHLWFSARSQRVSRGDHLFTLGAGRHSAVLGLFEVTSPGMNTMPRNPWDPERWPYAAEVRVLAAVPPPQATSVESLTAPRGAPQAITDAARRDALYAAVADHALPADADAAPPGHVLDDVEEANDERRARAFDPARAPTPGDGDGAFDQQEALDRREKATQGHHQILVRLGSELAALGWTDLEEIRTAFDLRGVRPDGGRVFFEAKTISDTNAIEQTRKALAQLLEYRLDHGQPEDALCVVVDRAPPISRVGLLERLGVGCLLADDNGLECLNHAARALLDGDVGTPHQR